MATSPLATTALILAALLPVAGCLGCSEAAASNPNPPPTGGPVIVYHDFGILDLATRKSADLEIPVPKHDLGDIVVKDSFTGTCPCIVGMVMIRRGDGTTNAAYGLPEDQRVLHPGDKVILRLTLDTRNEEPVDVAKLELRGYVGFQLNSDEFARYETVVIRFDYGIRSPIKVAPVAHVDFGELPRSRKFHQVLTLSSNIEGQKIAWGAPNASPRCIAARLEEKDGETLLYVTITPNFDALRQVRGVITLSTGLDAYADLKIPVSGTFCSDIQYMPSEVIHFDLFDFKKPKERFLNVTDHNMSREPGFVLLGIRDTHGNDISEHFAVSFKPLSGRQTRVIVKYLGTMGGMRMIGELTLAKHQGGKQVARLTISGHNTRK